MANSILGYPINPLSPRLVAMIISQAHCREGGLILLTAPSGMGKTVGCGQLCQAVLASGIYPCGLLSPAGFTAGEKTHIDLVDIVSGERRRLAVKRESQNCQDLGGLTTLDWSFNPETLAWGETKLHVLLNKSDAKLDFLIIDEMGVLEFERGQGWVSGLELIDRRNYRTACISIRPSLLRKAQKRWPWGRAIRLTRGSKP